MGKINELKGMSKEDLKSRLIELRTEMIKNNAQIATGTNPSSPGQVKQTKKTIAKILTILKEKGPEEPKKSKTKEEE